MLHAPMPSVRANSLHAVALAVAVAACGTDAVPAGGTDDTGGTGPTTAEPTTTQSSTQGTTISTTTVTTAAESSESTTATVTGADESTTAPTVDLGGRPEDPCDSGTAFCEPFDGYAETALADQQTFGPWRAAVSDGGATMDLDGTHTVSGDRALHVRLEGGGTSGGRLFTEGDVPLLDGTPTHVYGRMMMYIGDNGPSVHWTFFGAQGQAEPGTPPPGDYASYIMSSLPRDGVNTFSFVDGLSGGPDYQDCWAQSRTPMPTEQWTCVSFEMDSVERRLRMYLDGGEAPIVAVDGTGQGCVQPVPGDSPWYGPAIEALFVGTWSFHPMEAPLEVWIDDLVVDTAPVDCP
jgi:hypothetical protein